MVDRLIDIYALLWAMCWVYIRRPIRHWYRRHRNNPDYFTHLGWLVGVLVSIMMILWGMAK